MIFFVLLLYLLFITVLCDSTSNTDHEGREGCGCHDLSRKDIEIPKIENNVLADETITAGIEVDGQQQQQQQTFDSKKKNKKSSNTKLSKFIYLEGGFFTMGTDTPSLPQDGEGPARKVFLDPFYVEETEVSNEQFARFVEETNFITETEKFEWSFVFEFQLDSKTSSEIDVAVAGVEWWLPVTGAYWKLPEGPNGNNVLEDGRADHPVVQVTWNDAVAYCKWRGGRLLTEAEWEFAARGGKENLSYPWGEKLFPGKHRCNTWQGKFPHSNTEKDSYKWTSPVKEYGPQNDYGLYGMIGNVWEWVSDYWTTDFENLPQKNPQGPSLGLERTKKGGSYLCHKSYCYRYRIEARTPTTPDSSSSNVGFRCAKDVE